MYRKQIKVLDSTIRDGGQHGTDTPPRRKVGPSLFPCPLRGPYSLN